MSFKGKTVKIEAAHPLFGQPEGPYEPFYVEDLWTKVSEGEPWEVSAKHNLAAMGYAGRVVNGNLPKTGDVYYGKYHGLGYLVHESEIKEIGE